MASMLESSYVLKPATLYRRRTQVTIREAVVCCNIFVKPHLRLRLPPRIRRTCTHLADDVGIRHQGIHKGETVVIYVLCGGTVSLGPFNCRISVSHRRFKPPFLAASPRRT